MAFFENYRAAQAKLTAREAVATLDYMDDAFEAGSKWAQGVYSAENGARCLVAAANHCKVSAIDSAKYWLMQAIKERMPHLKSIEEFNDQAQTFAEIAAVIRPRPRAGLGLATAGGQAGCVAARAAMGFATAGQPCRPSVPGAAAQVGGNALGRCGRAGWTAGSPDLDLSIWRRLKKGTGAALRNMVHVAPAAGW